MKRNRLTGNLAAGGTAVTAINAEKLDGIDSAVFGKTALVAVVNFEPRDSGTLKEYASTGAIYCTGAPGSDFQYRVPPRQGTRVTSIDYAFADGEGGRQQQPAARRLQHHGWRRPAEPCRGDGGQHRLGHRRLLRPLVGHRTILRPTYIATMRTWAP